MITIQSAQPNFTDRAPTRPHFLAARAFESTPWLLPTILQLEKLDKSGRDIRGIGDFRLTPGTVTMTRILLSRIPVGDLPEPKLVPISGGAVSIVWTLSGGQIDFTVYPNEGHFAYVVTDRGDEVISDGILGFDEEDRISTIFNSRRA
ncbi:MAG: hypothetical protein WBQ34_11645 [Candidatus Acidiferrales bacterium]